MMALSSLRLSRDQRIPMSFHFLVASAFSFSTLPSASFHTYQRCAHGSQIAKRASAPTPSSKLMLFVLHQRELVEWEKSSHISTRRFFPIRSWTIVSSEYRLICPALV